MDGRVSDVRLEDVLRTDDPVMSAAMAAIAGEAREQALGGPLYIESVARSLIIHLLRRYAAVETKVVAPKAGLSAGQSRIIRDFIETHLAEPLDLTGMAAVLGLTPCLFARLFRASFGQPPYAYVISRRLALAGDLLSRTRLAIKDIAASCGFSDQAHLTRLFSREIGTTPAAYRKARLGEGG